VSNPVRVRVVSNNPGDWSPAGQRSAEQALRFTGRTDRTDALLVSVVFEDKVLREYAMTISAKTGELSLRPVSTEPPTFVLESMTAAAAATGTATGAAPTGATPQKG
jgi:hypothetical protein